MITRHLATWAVALGLCAVVTTASAEIVVRNGSFEDDWLPDGGWAYGNPTHWAAHKGGVYNGQNPPIDPPAIHGEMLAFVDGLDGWLAQELRYDTGDPVLSYDGLTFDLDFWLGRFDETDLAGTYAPVVEVILECEYGGQWETFASFTYDSGAHGLGRGEWHHVTSTLTMTGFTGYEDWLGRQVVVTFWNRTDTGTDPGPYGQALIDAVPEPATLGLFVASGACLLRRRRTR